MISSQTDCNACPIKDKCLGEKTKQKQTQRWEHQELLDNYNANMQTNESKAIIKDGDLSSIREEIALYIAHFKRYTNNISIDNVNTKMI